MSSTNNKRYIIKSVFSCEEFEPQEWLLCRKIIVCTGSVLSIIYGLAILTATQWLRVESSKLTELLVEPNASAMSAINNYFFTSFYIMVIGLLGIISPFIKSDQINYSIDSHLTKSNDLNNNDKSQFQVKSFINDDKMRNKEEAEETIDIFLFLSQKYSQLSDSFKNLIKISPLFSNYINAILIVTIIPIELAITVTTCQSMIKRDDNMYVNNVCLYCAKVKEEVFRLTLCLAVLYVSVILIQICVFAYIIDLLYSHIKQKFFQKLMTPQQRDAIRSRINGESPTSYWEPRIEQKLRLQNEKNVQFLQSIQRGKQLEDLRQSPDLQRCESTSSISADNAIRRQSTSSDTIRGLPYMPRTASKASTIRADNAFQRQSTSYDRDEHIVPQSHVSYDI